MIKLWLSKNSGVSIREQLTRQIILAIVSGDLDAGCKLPSVRALALRHEIHPNTANAAYRRLEENGWVETRVGSGVFVRDVSQKKIAEAARNIENDLDELIRSFLKEARQSGFSRRQIKARLNTHLNSKSPQNIVVIEKDNDLSRILINELSENFSLPISAVENLNEICVKNSLIVSLAELNDNLPASQSFIKLKLNSAQNSMRDKTKPAETDLIGIASHWEMFRRWSQTMLVAAGINEENLVVRDASKSEWQKGLSSCRFIIADSLTAKNCRNLTDTRIFHLVSDDSIEEIRKFLA